MKVVKKIWKKIKPIDVAIIAALVAAIGVAGYVSTQQAQDMQDGAVAYYIEETQEEVHF